MPETLKIFDEYYLLQNKNKVDVVKLPRNTDWITNSPEGLKRLNTTLKIIEDATGITIKNHQCLQTQPI